MFANMPSSPNISYSSKANGPPIEDLFDTIKSNDPSVTKSAFQDSFLGYGNNNSMMQNSFVNLNTSVNSQSLSAPWQDECQEQDEYWVTVFGFPPNAANTVLARFSNCGAILGKIFFNLFFNKSKRSRPSGFCGNLRRPTFSSRCLPADIRMNLMWGGHHCSKTLAAPVGLPMHFRPWGIIAKVTYVCKCAYCYYLTSVIAGPKASMNFLFKAFRT